MISYKFKYVRIKRTQKSGHAESLKEWVPEQHQGADPVICIQNH
jgi:hypothetical protein